MRFIRLDSESFLEWFEETTQIQYQDRCVTTSIFTGAVFLTKEIIEIITENQKDIYIDGRKYTLSQTPVFNKILLKKNNKVTVNLRLELETILPNFELI